MKIWLKECKSKRRLKRTVFLLKILINLHRIKAIKRRERIKREVKMDKMKMEEMDKIMGV